MVAHIMKYPVLAGNDDMRLFPVYIHMEKS